MKMSIGEKKILFVFGCPNHEAMVDRLNQVSDLIPNAARGWVMVALADSWTAKTWTSGIAAFSII